MPKILDVVAITGKYEKNGVEKNSYKTVGMIIEKDGKKYLKLDHLVTVDSAGKAINFFNLFEPKPRDAQPSQSVNQSFNQDVPQDIHNDDDLSDSIPF